jgi:6-phosphogluconolactonase
MDRSAGDVMGHAMTIRPPAIQSAPTPEAIAARLADAVAGEIAAIIADQGHCVLAVAGGKTPIPFFHALTERAIEWDDVTVTLTDERYVPLDHPESNEAMVRRELLRGRATRARFSGLYRAADSAEASLDGLSSPGTIDIAVLGMGDDRHTLSWFPGAEGLIHALSTAEKRRLAVVRPGILTPRVTLTAGALGRAKFAHLLIHGPAKRAALDAALAAGSIEDAPVARLFAYRTLTTDVFWSEAG